MDPLQHEKDAHAGGQNPLPTRTHHYGEDGLQEIKQPELVQIENSVRVQDREEFQDMKV